MDEMYGVARRVLLDALEALGEHRQAIIVVGAQALYLRTGEADIAVSPYTTDGDLALDPALLAEIPPLEQALVSAQFDRHPDQVGVWVAHRPTAHHPELKVEVDLLVPASISPGKGRRAAHLRGHAPAAARIVRGLEGVVVDFDTLPIYALEAEDSRIIHAKIAGPAALLVAKVHKIADRQGTGRSRDKDALDIFRLFRAVSTEELAVRMALLLADGRSRTTTQHGISLVREQFHARGEGTRMTVRAVEGLMPEAEVRASLGYLVGDLLECLDRV